MLQNPSYLITVALDSTGVTVDMLNQFNTADNVPPPDLLQVMQNPKNAISVLGPYELQFHLAKVFPPFMATLTQPQDFAVDPRVVSTHGGVKEGTNDWMSANAVGCGPFMITQYLPNTITVFERNPNYWGGSNGIQPTPRLDKVMVKVVPNALTRMEDLASGSSQLGYLDVSLSTQTLANGGLYIPHFGDYPYLVDLALNTQRFPFNTKLVRQAVAHAIDDTALLQLFYGLGVSFVGPVPKGVPGYNYTLQPYSYNVTLAKQLLAQAGYPDGKGLPEVTLLSCGTEEAPWQDLAPVIQSNLADIGIKVKIVTMSLNAMEAIVSTTPPTSPSYPDMIGWEWYYFPDPWTFTDLAVGPTAYGPANPAYYNNTQVNALLERADSTVDQTERARIYENIAEIVYDEVPYVWVAQFHNSFPSGVIISNMHLQGFVPNFTFYPLDFSTLYLV